MFQKILIVVFLSATQVASAEAMELPHLIGEGMVMQRDRPIPVWGQASAGSEIQVRLDDKTYVAVSDVNGDWKVELPAMPAGGPHTLLIEGEGESRAFHDVWMGDVWVCSGQSNMEWPLEATENADYVIASADDALIRHFKVPRSWAVTPQQDLQGGTWETASPNRSGQFTAVGYYFAQHIRKEVDVPIGLINSSWGGSSIESWMDAPLLGIDRNDNAALLQGLEAKEAAEAERFRLRYSQWPGALDGDIEQATADWSAPDLDETGWVEIQAPALWEDQGFEGLDGVAWYRKTFELTREQTGHDLELGLSRIDDQDITFVNGNKVGETDKYFDVRQYTVKKEWLREGKNTVAVRVLDGAGGGGIWSEPGLAFLRGPSVDLSLAGTWLFKVDKGRILVGADRNQTPTALYNRMMHPLFKIPVKGVLWYQGEANAFEEEAATRYRDQFRSLITDWRAKWGDENLPFYWVQLANFISGADTKTVSPWAILRESQTESLTLPRTGQAVIIDVGDPDDIHPRDKNTVGERLARHALKNDYGFSAVVSDGPYAQRASVSGEKVVVEFRTASHLVLQQGDTAAGFELTGGEGNWYPATAVLRGQSVELRSDAVGNPSSVRYAWSDNPEEANLTDASGLPANPFRFELPGLYRTKGRPEPQEAGPDLPILSSPSSPRE